jgi:hypothetical protein
MVAKSSEDRVVNSCKVLEYGTLVASLACLFAWSQGSFGSRGPLGPSGAGDDHQVRLAHF